MIEWNSITSLDNDIIDMLSLRHGKISPVFVGAPAVFNYYFLLANFMDEHWKSKEPTCLVNYRSHSDVVERYSCRRLECNVRTA